MWLFEFVESDRSRTNRGRHADVNSRRVTAGVGMNFVLNSFEEGGTRSAYTARTEFIVRTHFH